MLEARVGRQFAAVQRDESRVRRHRVAALTLTAVCLALACWLDGPTQIVWTAWWLIVPVCAICFGEHFTEAESTPDFIVRLGGWIGLGALAIYWMFRILSGA